MQPANSGEAAEFASPLANSRLLATAWTMEDGEPHEADFAPIPWAKCLCRAIADRLRA